jgi:hypothetical protein
MVMAVVGMVRECVAATTNHHFDISGRFGGSLVGEIWILIRALGRSDS